MADTLATLIKVLGWRVDMQQRQLAAASRHAEHLRQKHRDLHIEVATESAAAREAPPGPGNTFPAYARAAIERDRRLQTGITEAEADVSDRQAGLRDAFAERKRLELLAERRRQREEAEEARRQQHLLDEIAQSRHLGRPAEP